MLAAELPDLAAPAVRLRRPVPHRQHVAGRHAEIAFVLGHDAGALRGIVDPRIGRIDIGRQRAFLQHVIGRILEGGQHMLGRDAEAGGEANGEPVRIVDRWRGSRAGRGDQRGVLPDRLAVLAPAQREGPARQRLARIPFALAVM